MSCSLPVGLPLNQLAKSGVDSPVSDSPVSDKPMSDKPLVNSPFSDWTACSCVRIAGPCSSAGGSCTPQPVAPTMAIVDVSTHVAAPRHAPRLASPPHRPLEDVKPIM